MRLKNVARFFDKEPAYDGYDNSLLFRCQYSSFDDSAGDGSTNRRRGMSTAANVVIPARGCLKLGDQRWLVGSATDDSFQAAAMRKNYNLKRVTNSLAILTVTGAATAASGTAAYAQLHYFKDTANALNDADMDTFWNVFFVSSEPVVKGTFLRDEANTLYRVREVYIVPEGLLIAQTDQLDADALQAIVLGGDTYDAINDTVSGSTVSVDVVQVDMSKFYRNRLPDEFNIRGDRTVFIPATTPVTVGQTFTMQSAEWRIVTTQTESDATVCTVRRK